MNETSDKDKDELLITTIRDYLTRGMADNVVGTRIIVLTKHGRAYTLTATEDWTWDIEPQLERKILGESIYEIARITKKIMQHNPSKCSVTDCHRPAMGLLCISHYDALEPDIRDLYKKAVTDEEKANVVRLASEATIDPKYDVWSDLPLKTV